MGEKIRNQHLYNVRAGLTMLQIRLKFGAAGAVGSDGYGNTLQCNDVVRTSGDEKWSDKHQWVKGLVWDGEWSETAPVTLDGTGKYTLRFDDTYFGLTSFKWGIEDGSNTKKNNVVLVSFTASDTSGNSGRSSAVIQFCSTAGAAVAPDSGSSVWLEFGVKTSEQG
jgi:hypothetical protein